MTKLKKLAASLVAVASIGAIGITSFASYSYGKTHKDAIASKTSQAFDLSKHTYAGNDIGANDIHVTAPSRVDYYLELYVDSGFLGIYNQYGLPMACDTEVLGGYGWWDSVRSDGGSSNAHLRIERTDSSTTTLGGYVSSRARTWS